MLKKLGNNILIYGGTNIIKSLVPFFMLPILTAYLSAKDYGILSLIEVSVLFIAPFVTLNINSAINVEYFKLSKEELKNYISNALLLSFFSATILLFLAYFFKTDIANAIHLSQALIVLLPFLAFLRVVSGVLLGLYQVSEKALNFASFTIMQTIIDFLLSIIFVIYLKLGYAGRLGGVYVAFFIFSLYGIYLLYQSGYIKFSVILDYSKDILSYGLPLIPHVLGGVILAMSDRYFLSYFHGNDVVGYYSVAYQIGAIMLLASISINQAWMPMLFKMLKNYTRNKELIIKYTLYLSFLYTIIWIGLYLFQDIVFKILVNQKFDDAKIFFPALLSGFLFQSYYYLITNILFFYKKTTLLAKLTFTSAIINLLLNYILIHTFGAIGVAYATAITYLLYLLVVYYFSKKILKQKEF